MTKEAEAWNLTESRAGENRQRKCFRAMAFRAEAAIGSRFRACRVKAQGLKEPDESVSFDTNLSGNADL